MGKKITVKATCGTTTSAPSVPVTIPSVTYTVVIEQYEVDSLCAYVKVGNDLFGIWETENEEGFICQWERNRVAITGRTKSEYYLQAADVGTKIRATVTGSSKTVSSSDIQIDSPDPGLAETIWKAMDETTSSTYTLTFSSDYNTWCMEIRSVYGWDSQYGTYTVSGNKVVFMTPSSNNKLEGDIVDDTIVFPDAFGNSDDGFEDLVFSKRR